jgi:ferredoxin-nitrate reductase
MRTAITEDGTTKHKSTCPYCGFGCGLLVEVCQDRIVQVRGMQEHPVNRGDICPMAASLPELFAAEGRLRSPLIRRDGQLVSVTWQEAVSHVAGRLSQVISEHGPSSVAFYGGAANLTEEYYLMNKLMKGAIGTNNVECSTRLCMASSAMGFTSTLGADAPPTCYGDIEDADLFFIAGSNMAVSLPVLFRRVQAAKEKNGAKVIVIDPRVTETAAIADIHLQIRPGTDVALNNALAHVLFKEGFVNKEAVDARSSGRVDLRELVDGFPPSRGEEITGCPEAQIIRAARMIGNARAMLTFWFMGYNHSSQAVFKNNTLHNLSLLTGNFCRPGAGPLSITGEANALGNRWVGALSHLLPGMRLVTNFQHRQDTAEYWGIPVEKIQKTPGKSIIDIIKGIDSGDIRALWVATTNPAMSLPNSTWVGQALSKCELLIAQDIFPTETTERADVVLPAAQWGEKTGTFISSERRIELVEKLITPPGEAKPDYEIVWLVARAMGFEDLFPYTSPEQVFEEWKGMTRGRICDMNGVTYARLRGKIGPQLPCSNADHAGTARLFVDRRFPRPDGRAALLARDYAGPVETPDEEFPFVLITGRLVSHFNSRTRTGRIRRLNACSPHGVIDIHPKDAARQGITESSKVEVASRRGAFTGAARLTTSVVEGTVFASMHYGSALGHRDELANLACHEAYDIHSKQPEFKHCAVRVTKAPHSSRRQLDD